MLKARTQAPEATACLEVGGEAQGEAICSLPEPMWPIIRENNVLPSPTPPPFLRR